MMVGECRILNLSVNSKRIDSDCLSTAEISPTYKEVIQHSFEMFNP